MPALDDAMSSSPITRSLAAGSLFFAGWGLLRPRSLGRRMGLAAPAARQVGVREAVIGTMLLVQPGTASLAGRVIADIADTAQTWHHDRRVAAVALASAATATTLAVLAGRRAVAP